MTEIPQFRVVNPRSSESRSNGFDLLTCGLVFGGCSLALSGLLAALSEIHKHGWWKFIEDASPITAVLGALALGLVAVRWLDEMWDGVL